MPVTTISIFHPPCKMPNGLQWTDEGLYVIDQYSDYVYLLDDDGYVIRSFMTPTANGSGITYGDGYVWTASNGQNNRREKRDTDTNVSWIYKLNPRTGEFVNRWRTPDGGGIHGIEWDNGKIWVTGFNPKAILLCDPDDDLKVLNRFEVKTERLHGLARDGDGIWCAHTSDKVIIKYSVESGAEVDRIEFAPDAPAPHGLSIKDGVLWYCDANVNSPKQHQVLRDKPDIGIVKR